MSGTFNPDEPGITATDDPDLARKLGFSQYNRATEQWEAPTAPDVGQRDGTDVPGHVDFVSEQGPEVADLPDGSEIKPADDGTENPADDAPPADDVPADEHVDTPATSTRKRK